MVFVVYQVTKDHDHDHDNNEEAGLKEFLGQTSSLEMAKLLLESFINLFNATMISLWSSEETGQIGCQSKLRQLDKEEMVDGKYKYKFVQDIELSDCNTTDDYNVDVYYSVEEQAQALPTTILSVPSDIEAYLSQDKTK
jgi:hypothetical protein